MGGDGGVGVFGQSLDLDVVQLGESAYSREGGLPEGGEGLAELLKRLDAIRFSGEWVRAWLAGTLPPARLADPIAELSKIDIRVLLLHGRQDMRFPASGAERAADLFPRARVVVIDQAGHMTQIDQNLVAATSTAPRGSLSSGSRSRSATR